MAKYPRRLLDDLIKDPPTPQELDYLDALLQKDERLGDRGIASMFPSSSNDYRQSLQLRSERISSMIFRVSSFNDDNRVGQELTMERFSRVLARDKIKLCNRSTTRLLSLVNPSHFESISATLGADCWSVLWAIREAGIKEKVSHLFFDRVFKECASQVQFRPPNSDDDMFMEFACELSLGPTHHAVDVIVSTIKDKAELVRLAHLHRHDDVWGCKHKSCRISNNLADFALYGLTKHIVCSHPLNSPNEWKRVDLRRGQVVQDPTKITFVARFLDEVESILVASVGVKQIARLIAKGYLVDFGLR